MRVLSALFALAFAVPSLAAQSLLVTALKSETGMPIQGALVTLENAQGSPVRSGLTDEHGRLVFQRLKAGSYRVTVEMMGRATGSSDLVAVEHDGQWLTPLLLPVLPIELDRLLVEGDRQCRLLPEQGLLTARLWEEARKALRAARWSEAQNLYRYRLRTYERDLGPGAARVRREESGSKGLVTANPIRSLSAEDLTEKGYIRALESGEYDYFAPDADVLLSDTFLKTHCMRALRVQASDSVIGLAFEPVRRGSVPDIAGAFWLQREDARLRWVTFQYTSLPWRVDNSRVGGEVHFERLPAGTWVVRRWFIRMPLLGHVVSNSFRNESADVITGFREAGQEVTSIRTFAGTTILDATWGALEGVVMDSTRGVPLAGATVALAETPYSAVTDHAGHFLLTGLPDGRFALAFTHPRLDSLGVELPAVEVSITRGGLAHAELAVPSTNTLWAAGCPEDAGDRGVLLGTVRDAGTDVPVVDAWVEVTRPGRTETTRLATDPQGRFRMCGVEAGQAVLVRAGVASLATDTVRAQVRPASWVEVSLRLPLADLVATPSGRVAPSARQLLRGRVVDAATGKVVPMAEVTVRRVGAGEPLASELSGDDGSFGIPLPGAGTFTVGAQALGFDERVEGTVQVGAGQVVEVELRLEARALALDPLFVTVEARSLKLDRMGFYDRQKLAAPSTFFTPERIEKRAAEHASDLLREVPGVVLTQGSFGHSLIHIRGSERPVPGGGVQVCWPRIYVDGVLLSVGGMQEPAAIDELVDPGNIEGIEVYRRAAELPARFGGAQAACGVIVIWTKR